MTINTKNTRQLPTFYGYQDYYDIYVPVLLHQYHDQQNKNSNRNQEQWNQPTTPIYDRQRRRSRRRCFQLGTQQQSSLSNNGAILTKITSTTTLEERGYHESNSYSICEEQGIVFTTMMNHQKNWHNKTPPNKLSPSCAPQKMMTIEIAPGIEMMLRGAQETTKAIENDFLVSCQCYTCTETIFCIGDAEYSLCPTCRIINPIDIEKTGTQYRVGGVGLGVTASDITNQQQRQRKQRLVCQRGGKHPTTWVSRRS